MEVLTHTPSETQQLGSVLSKQIRGGLVALIGPLGSGKTTFVRGFVQGAGFADTVRSPTFQLHRQYGNIHHIDLYRIDKKVPLEELGILELLSNTSTVVLVEWADKLKMLPENYVEIRFVPQNTVRKVTITKHKRNINIPEIKKAARVILSGGIVVYPTDTVYGIGCRIDNQKSVERLYEIKQRPWTLPVPVLVRGKEQLLLVVSTIPAHALSLMEMHWPGSLTIILPARIDNIAPLILAGGNAIGVREPNHETTCALLSECGVPIVGTSANIHDQPSVARIEELDSSITRQADSVLEGSKGSGVESTIVDATKENVCIVREGAITLPGISKCAQLI